MLPLIHCVHCIYVLYIPFANIDVIEAHVTFDVKDERDQLLQA